MRRLFAVTVLGLFMVLSTSSAVFHLSVEKTMVDHPDWADGIFVGVWGLRNHTLGYFAGYYDQRNRFHFFVGVWNTTNNSKWGYIRGLTIGPYMLGKVNVSGDNKMTPIVGLFVANETRFVAKVMSARGVVGATGRYQPLEW